MIHPEQEQFFGDVTISELMQRRFEMAPPLWFYPPFLPF
jgi:hypothetical protein